MARGEARASTDALVARLREVVGDGRVDADGRGDLDLSRHSLGIPLARVRPRDTGEVAQVVVAARAAGVPVVPAGQRTAYWRPLRFDGAVVLETSGLDRIEEPDWEGGLVWCGAGATVRAVDDRLRAGGAALAAYPDAFGDTSVGAMVATGFCAGLGMGLATLSDLVGGLRVVLGTGEVLPTGAGLVLQASAFVRVGLPDPTELFFASEGALGVVTEVAIRLRPLAARTQLSWAVPAGPGGVRAVVAFARRLRAPGLYETLRATWERGPEAGGAEPLRVDLVLQSPLDAAELEGRVRAATALARECLVGAPPPSRCAAPGDAPDPAGDGHWARMGRGHFVGVDVVAPYGELEACWEVAEEVVARARQRPSRSLRSALYFAPGFVNLGLHFVFEGTSDAAVREAHGLIEWAIARLAPLRVIPYRWGRAWGPALGPKLDPVYRALVHDLKRRCDPDGILHPGASLFDPAPGAPGAPEAPRG